MKVFIERVWWFIAVTLGIISLVLFVVSPEYSTFNQYLVMSFFGLLLVLLFIRRKDIQVAIKKSFIRNSITNIITIFLIFCIVGITNFISLKNTKYVDITNSQVHTLTDQTKTVLDKIDSPIKMTLFANRSEWKKYLSLLNLYKYTHPKVEIDAIDVDTNPSLVKLNNISESGTVIIEYLGKKMQIKLKDELALTNAIIKLQRAKTLKVYYTTGHGELNRQLDTKEGGKFLFNKIKDSNYNLIPLDILRRSEVPEDADALLILGPRDSFLDMELNTLKKYLDKGGDMLITLGPEFDGTKNQNFYDLIAKYGLRFKNAIVVDRLSTVQNTQATIPIVNEYNLDHRISKKFEGRTLFPLSGAIFNSTESNGDLVYSAIANSSPFPASWAESDLAKVATGNAVFDIKDTKGPVALASVVENTKLDSRLAMFASSSFIVNGYQGQSSNFNLFLNTLAWVIKEEGIISLNRPELTNEMILLSASQITLIFYFSILFLPFLLFAIAIIRYRIRLKK